jgi:hypothetical protein
MHAAFFPEQRKRDKKILWIEIVTTSERTIGEKIARRFQKGFAY